MGLRLRSSDLSLSLSVSASARDTHPFPAGPPPPPGAAEPEAYDWSYVPTDDAYAWTYASVPPKKKKLSKKAKAALEQQLRDVKAQQKRVSSDLRSENKKRERLMGRAMALSDEEMLQVMAARAHAKAKAKAKQ